MATQCGTDGILVTAFRSGTDYTIHVSNAKWERPITIVGLPLGVKEFHVIRTAAGEYFKRLETVAVRSGTVPLVLPAESLTTLTTLEVGAPVPMSNPGR